jgi:DNA polymerase III subunit delta'
MGFSGILGHQKQIETLRLALAKGRLHHGYLFAGPEGVGKRTLALALAKAIHCSEGSDDFCGRCANCASIESRNHPDVRLVEPISGKKEISIQQIREIQKELSLRSFSGKKRIAIIDPATLMNLSAQNALLKTLEEPPQDSLLILVAPNAGALLPTLRSRCLRLSFGPLPRDLLSSFLISEKGIKREEADFLAAMAMGSVGAAVKIAAESLRDQRQGWITLLSSLRAADYSAATAAAETLASSKEESLKFLSWAEGWYRDALVQAVNPESSDIINQDVKPEIERQFAGRNLEHMLASVTQTAAATSRIQRNLNRRMVLEKLFLDIVGEG